MTAIIKCVLVSDRAVGKTCLLFSFTSNEFPQGHVPSIFFGYADEVIRGGETYIFQLFDTVDERRICLNYPNTTVFLVCFSVISPASFESVKEKWVPQITDHCPKTPFILVGTKTDLRDDAETIEKLSQVGQSPITAEAAEALAREVGAVEYVECSALTQEGVKSVFDKAISVAVEHLRIRKCVLL